MLTVFEQRFELSAEFHVRVWFIYKLLITQPDFIYVDILICFRHLCQKKLVQFFFQFLPW